MQKTVSYDTIMTLAERETGAYGLADEGLRQRLRAMIDHVNDNGPHSVDQVDAMQRQLQRQLARRLLVALDRRRFPGIVEEKIERPIFIVGFPRSGTTLLHSLMAEDPDVLAPQSWHVLEPSPPPGAGPVCSGRMARAQRAVEQWMDFCPGQVAMHPYIDKGAVQLIEDEEVYGLDLRFPYPYEFYKFASLVSISVPNTDVVGTLRFHRELLQHLQWNTGKTRWVCKSPSVQHNLEPLFEVYRDALCIWSHRSLPDIFASNVALMASVYDTIKGEPIDWAATARSLAEGTKTALDHLMNSALIDDPRLLHLPFADLAADPLGTVKMIYDRVGLSVSQVHEARMQAWLADPDNRADRYGRYPYSYEAFGLDQDWLEDLFADYSRRFDLTSRQ
jgi:hypothetical protein